jgi:hypothetical protein
MEIIESCGANEQTIGFFPLRSWRFDDPGQAFPLGAVLVDGPVVIHLCYKLLLLMVRAMSRRCAGSVIIPNLSNPRT